MTNTLPKVPESVLEPRVPPLVGLVWALLLINTLGTSGMPTVIPFSKTVGQLITMSALCVAVGLAVVLNPRVHLRPNSFLLLLSLLLLVGIVSSLRLEGSLFRCFRGVIFVAALWLLSRWWRGDLSFVRYHIRFLFAVLCTVLLGLAISPGTAMPADYQGRLVGSVWPMPAPQVGQYAAVVAGLTILLWLTHKADGRSAAVIAPLSIGILLLSHTRTATVAFVIALVGASLTLVLTSARSRHIVGVTGVFAGALCITFWPSLQKWFARGQDPEFLNSLTGRAKVWDMLIAKDRTLDQELLGIGLTDKSFNGLSIDSSWLAVYLEQGLVGVAIVAVMLVGLLATAAFRPPSPARACAVFLVLFCAITSYTEVGLNDVSSYLLHLAVAASLLVHNPATASVPTASARGTA